VAQRSRLALLVLPDRELVEVFAETAVATRSSAGDETIGELVQVLGRRAAPITPTAIFSVLRA
jgi:hypothetical protein